MSNVSERLIEIVCERLDVKPEEVTSEASFIENLGADSLDIVDLAMEIEEAFAIQIRDEDYLHLTRLGDAVSYIEARLAEKAQEAAHAVDVSPTASA